VQVRLAEQLGYDIVVVPDHVGDQLAPFPALVSAAEATNRVRLGTFVIDNDFRHPMLLAQEAATVDLLTEGDSSSASERDGWDRTINGSAPHSIPPVSA
jgi:alkanesulfonate monooxygenase SsuD/methylene tetrahydromethanopterin reductase-like flavin-dependent oxidoreductase (luciferase family)